MTDLSVSHHYTTAPDCRLHYVTAGDPNAQPIVLLHGWPQTWYEWRKIIPRVTDSYRIIAPDLRGLGDSDRPPTGYDKTTVAHDIRALVESLEHESIALVGHDWGMPVAYLYAALYRESVSALVMLDASLPGIDGQDDGTGLSLPNGAPVWHFGFHMTRDLPERLITGNERSYLTWFFRELAHNPGAISTDAIDEFVRCYSQPGALRAGFEYYRAAFTDAVDIASHAETPLDIPVLAYGGRRGFSETTKAVMDAVATSVQGGVIEECGHWIPEERPDFISSEILDFLESADWN